MGKNILNSLKPITRVYYSFLRSLCSVKESTEVPRIKDLMKTLDMTRAELSMHNYYLKKNGLMVQKGNRNILVSIDEIK